VKFVKVQDNPGLVRDTETGAIICIDDASWQKHRKNKQAHLIRAEQENAKEQRLNRLENQVQDLKTNIDKILELLTDSFDLWAQKTNLAALNQGDNDRLIVPMQFKIAGTVSSFGVDLVGAGTNFISELNVGTIVHDIATGQRRRVIEISSATTAKTDVAFTPSLSLAEVATVDFVTALNTAFEAGEDKQRALLIRAIAMS